MTTVAPHSDPEARLAELGLALPEPPPALANYALAVRHGDLLYLAGHAPLREGRHRYVGRVGRELSQQDGYDAARLTALNMLATIKAELGDLARVRRIVKVLGMVACTEDFVQLPEVIDGATDLFVALWGERGRPARSAVGMQQLHYGMAVEIEGIVEIDRGTPPSRRSPSARDDALTVGPVEVQVTCGSAEEAAAIGQRLIEAGLAARALAARRQRLRVGPRGPARRRGAPPREDPGGALRRGGRGRDDHALLRPAGHHDGADVGHGRLPRLGRTPGAAARRAARA